MMIEFHMLKNYPPVNLNRDDSGAPKNCFFGGVQRGRISSQCLKRSWRTSKSFEALDSVGYRTRWMPKTITIRLMELGVEPEFAQAFGAKLTGFANKDEKINDKGLYTTQIVIYSEDELEGIAQALKAAADGGMKLAQFKKKKLSEIVGLKDALVEKPVSLDIALFGRMVTSQYLANVDASIQVAHAISTHAVNRETDYFTAVDDLSENLGEAGAAYLDGADFNSCCYYEYAALDLDKLSENLEKAEDRDALMRGILPALLRAMAFTNPSGKQNSFAGHVMPDFMMLELKEDKIPLSYVNAFEEPVAAWRAEPKIVRNSVQKLVEEIDLMDRAYALPIEARIFFAPRYEDCTPARAVRCADFAELVERCASWTAR